MTSTTTKQPVDSPPYARMVGNRFDVSAYCAEPLVRSIDHLTSVKFALFALIRPALKIAARSLFIENENITFSNILSHLNTETPITDPPPEARPQRPKRTFSQRIIHFFTVGIPLAILVGLVAGIGNFIKTIANDIVTILSLASKLYSMSQSDAKFYKENPHLIPPRNVAIDGVINTGLSFYTRRLIYRKLGMFSFLAKPFMSCLEAFLTQRVIKFCDKVEYMRNRYNSNQSTQPSAPPPPYSNEKFD